MPRRLACEDGSRLLPLVRKPQLEMISSQSITFGNWLFRESGSVRIRGIRRVVRGVVPSSSGLPLLGARHSEALSYSTLRLSLSRSLQLFFSELALLHAPAGRPVPDHRCGPSKCHTSRASQFRARALPPGHD